MDLHIGEQQQSEAKTNPPVLPLPEAEAKASVKAQAKPKGKAKAKAKAADTLAPAPAVTLVEAATFLDEAASAAAPKAREVEPRSSPLAERIQHIEALARDLCMYEAGMALRELDSNAQALADPDKDAALLRRLQGDALFTALRSFTERYDKAISDILVPSQREDVEWTTVTIRDTEISVDFSLELKIRYKSKEEHDPQGPWSQFSARADIRHFPMKLSRRVCIEREVDLLQDIIAATGSTVELHEGDVGDDRRLFGACMHTVAKARLSPWKTDNYEVREFTRFREAPQAFLHPGVVGMMASSPSEEAKELAGFPIKPCGQGCKRMGITILRFVEAEDVTDRCRIIVMAQGGVNVPSWLLPVSLVARIFTNSIGASMKHMANTIAPQWDKLPFQERIDKCEQFYASMQQCDSKLTPS